MIRKILASSAIAIASMSAAASAQNANVGALPLNYGGESTLTFSSKGGSAGKAFPSPFGVPHAFPAPNRTVFGSASYITPRSGVAGNGADGGLAFGGTLGSPTQNISVTAGVNIDSVSTNDFGDSGAVTLSFARALYVSEGNATFVGASVNNLLAWGDNTRDPEQFHGYVSHLTSLGAFPVMVTAGYGTDNTLSSNGTGVKSDGVFGGLGIGVTENISVGLSATETQANLGASLSVPGVPGLAVSAGVLDVTDNTNRQQFIVTVSFGKVVNGLFGN